MCTAVLTGPVVPVYHPGRIAAADARLAGFPLNLWLCLPRHYPLGVGLSYLRTIIG